MGVHSCLQQTLYTWVWNPRTGCMEPDQSARSCLPATSIVLLSADLGCTIICCTPAVRPPHATCLQGSLPLACVCHQHHNHPSPVFSYKCANKVTHGPLRLQITTEQIRELDKQTSWNIKDETPVVPFERTEVSLTSPPSLCCTASMENKRSVPAPLPTLVLALGLLQHRVYLTVMQPL